MILEITVAASIAFIVGWAAAAMLRKNRDADLYAAGYESGFCDGKQDEANRMAEPIQVRPRIGYVRPEVIKAFHAASENPGDFRCPPTVKLSDVYKKTNPE